jgi:hypothetical protein
MTNPAAGKLSMKNLLIIASIAACCMVPLTGHTAVQNGPATGEITQLQNSRFYFKCDFCGRATREPFRARCPERRKGLPHAWVKYRK